MADTDIDGLKPRLPLLRESGKNRNQICKNTGFAASLAGVYLLKTKKTSSSKKATTVRAIVDAQQPRRPETGDIPLTGQQVLTLKTC